jgi:hypothetical protein
MSTLRTLLLLILMSASIFAKAGEIEYATIDEFFLTLPEATRLDVSGYGFLDRSGSIYHAQLMQLDGKHGHQQIFIFRSTSNEKYILTNQSRKMEDMGGSGNWEVRDIKFMNRSVFITFQYQWHECSASFTSQFQIRNGKLVMIGRESFEANTKKNLAVETSENHLTGSAYTVSGNTADMYMARLIKSSQKTHPYKVPKASQPFSEFDGTPWHSPIYEKRPVC